ncbi:unnamed protein product [Calicophoron daubneyi]|uniref:Uncharacterized protein n=1 Tax=Calicophoron daubneyi TaxID=300641 RepID=A0AAV2TCP6_CALDB
MQNTCGHTFTETENMRLPKRWRQSLIFAATLIALYLCAGLIYGQKSSQRNLLWNNVASAVNRAHQESPNERNFTNANVIRETGTDSIHLALSVSKGTKIEPFYTLLKNILYYRGRFSFNRSECQIKIQTIRNDLCPITEFPSNDSLCLHLLVSNRIREIISATFDTWKPEDVQIIFYDSEDFEKPDEEEINNDRGEEVKMTNLLWPEIIQSSVTKVIVLDTDMLLNQNIANLWEMFTHFGRNQFIGGVFEQTTYLKRLMEDHDFRTLNTGINTGMLLLDLEKMRAVKWSKLWRKAAKEMSTQWNKLIFGDQIIFNYIIYNNPAYFHEISCEWNYVTFGHPNQADCPIVWMIQHAHKQYCSLSDWYRFKGLLLARLVHHVSDESPYPEVFSPVTSVRPFTVKEMKQTFQEVYSAFQRLNYRCFTREP